MKNKKKIKKSSAGNDIHSCKSCSSKLSVSYGPNPYNYEIKGDKTPVWLCAKCRKTFSEDV